MSKLDFFGLLLVGLAAAALVHASDFCCLLLPAWEDYLLDPCLGTFRVGLPTVNFVLKYYLKYDFSFLSFFAWGL